MRSRVLPWALLALVGGAWAMTTWLGSDTEQPASRVELRSENRTLRQDVLRLETEVERLRASADTEEAALRGSGAAPAAAATERVDPHAEARAEARRVQAEQSRRMEAVYAIMRPWIAALESVGDRREREDAIAAIRAALESDDPDMRLAGLLAVQALGDLKYDRGDFRSALLAHVHSVDRQERRAAREAVSFVNPQPEDVAMWAEEAREASREYAETVAGALVSSDGWKVESREAEDAVLHLLRDGTDIKRSDLLRGLQSARSFSPRVEARLIELVRGSDGRGSGMADFFYHFLGDKFDPMSDAMLEMVLGHVANERFMEAALRSLQSGLSEDQMKRVAARLLALADNAAMNMQLYHLLAHFHYLDGHGDPVRLQAFADDDEVPEETRELAAIAAEAARERRRR